jgi:hypothetical protein
VQGQQAGEQRPQVGPVLHPVDQAVREEELGGLEVGGQLGADRLLHHARSGEADVSAPLADQDRREGGE